jgi:hypothetical protein
MKLPQRPTLNFCRTAALVFACVLAIGQTQAEGFPDDTPVYYDGGKRGHIEGCRRLTDEQKAAGPTTTFGEMTAQGGQLCSRCPGSELNQEREAGNAGDAGSNAQPTGSNTPPSEPAASASPTSNFPDNTPVYFDGGKRGHIEGCPRLTDEQKAAGPNTTLGEMTAQEGQLCSRCPGSELNQQREADAAAARQNSGNAGMSRGERARAKAAAAPAVEYDPNTIVYVDALWYRVHAADSPSLLLKEHKKTMTLEEADRLGYRIGESGQSGREVTSFIGYRRKYPLREIPDDAFMAGNIDNTRQSKSYPGCHRRQMNNTFVRKTKADWIAAGFSICAHCIERGPSDATISEENWKKLPRVEEFVPPEGWVHKPFSPNQRPSAEEIEVLIQETLAGGSAIQELPFDNPVASVEQFSMMRFFFPVGQWLHLYKVYRSTGDQRVFDLMMESARHYNKLAKEFPSVAQLKASDPEGLPFMYTMALTARITLQKARQDPDSVTPEQIAEAEDFLRTIVSVLKPTYEGDENLDPGMGIPQPVANDFRERAFNRAMNGIGTLATAAVALEDLQAIKGSTEFQASIDRYRKTVGEYVKNWHKEGHFAEFDGKKHFYYPYSAGVLRVVDGEPIFNRPEDTGHYSHTLQGVLLIYEAMPEVGIDDEFMTAAANALHHNATTQIKRGGKMVLSGHVESPIMSRERPYGNDSGGHQYSPARDRLYLLQAFRDDMIDGLANPLNEQKKTAVNSEFDKRLATLHAQYLKAFRADRNLVHLAEKQ